MKLKALPRHVPITDHPLAESADGAQDVHLGREALSRITGFPLMISLLVQTKLLLLEVQRRGNSHTPVSPRPAKVHGKGSEPRYRDPTATLPTQDQAGIGVFGGARCVWRGGRSLMKALPTWLMLKEPFHERTYTLLAVWFQRTQTQKPRGHLFVDWALKRYLVG